MGVSPPTSTLSYIFPAKTRGPGGEVLRAASLTQPAAPSAESSWGRGARPPTPQPRLATRAGGRRSPEVPRQSRPAAPPVPGAQRGSCVGEGGVPRLPPGTPGRGPGTQRLHLEGAPVSSSMLSEAESRGSPSAPAGAGSARGGCAGHFLLPAGAAGLLPGEDSGWGWGPPRGSAFARPGAARRRSVSEVRAVAPRPEPARPLPGGPTPFPSAPSRPGTAPDLTLARRVRLRRAKGRELTERGGLWRAGGGAGKGEERRGREGRGKRLQRRSTRKTDGGRVRGEVGAARGGRDGRGAGVSPTPVPAPSLPVVWSVPGPALLEER